MPNLKNLHVLTVKNLKIKIFIILEQDLRIFNRIRNNKKTMKLINNNKNTKTATRKILHQLFKLKTLKIYLLVKFIKMINQR